jgi:hypothetical protein
MKENPLADGSAGRERGAAVILTIKIPFDR